MKNLIGLAFVFFGLFHNVAFAQSITINANAGAYSSVPAANGVTISSIAEVRVAGMTALVGAYRSINGLASLPVGTQVKVIWQGGSSETAVIVCLVGSVCAEPVPGTQQPYSGGGPGGPGDGGGPGGPSPGGPGGPGGGGPGGGPRGCEIEVGGAPVDCEVG